MRSRLLPVVLVIVSVLCARTAAAAPAILLKSAAAGVPLNGPATNATMNVRSGNGLGVGTPAAGVVQVTLASGSAYSSPFTISLTGWGGGASITVTAYVSTNFAHGGGMPAAIATVLCLSGGCASSADYQELPASSGSPLVVLSDARDKTSLGITLGALIGCVNGTGAFSGPDSATITFSAVDASSGKRATATLTISATVQQAVQFSIDSVGSIPVSTGSSTDYAADFGTVDGMGVSVGAGAQRTITPAGAVYSTSYVMRPAFSGMSSTLGTVRMHVSSNFAHTNLLQAQDSATGAAGTFAPISTNASSPTVVSSTAQSNVDLTRYLGLFVFTLNGAGAFAGADTATITYTFIVP